MRKLMLGAGLLFLFGSLRTTLAAEKVHREEARASSMIAHLSAIDSGSSSRALMKLGSGSTGRPIVGGGEKISDEERERRVQVCEKQWEQCMDWAKRSKGRAVTRKECMDQLEQCMKDIPYAN